MRTWKIWLMTIPLLLLMICAALVVWLWRNFSTNWGPETSSAQYVLDHTPLDHLQSYHVFTASGLQDVFEGTDALGREWYAFYSPQQATAYSVPARVIEPMKRIEAEATKLGIQSQQPTLGYITANAKNTLSTTSNVVYEVEGVKNGKTTFVYLDAANGRVLWQYQLQT